MKQEQNERQYKTDKPERAETKYKVKGQLILQQGKDVFVVRQEIAC
jgi:hypothetical protein